MRKKITYQTIPALLFLMLYCFVAMPVQFWHHHNNIGSNYQETTLTLKLKAFFAFTGNKEADCKICSHQFSVYTVGKEIINENKVFVYANPDSVFKVWYLFQEVKDRSNKSPPII